MVVNQKGFSLVEVACAMVVLTLTLSALVVGQAGSARSVSSAYEDVIASAWASGQLERLREVPALKVGASPIIIDETLQRQLSQPHAELEVKRRQPGLFEVSVELAWRPAGAREDRSILLTTLLARGVRR